MIDGMTAKQNRSDTKTTGNRCRPSYLCCDRTEHTVNLMRYQAKTTKKLRHRPVVQDFSDSEVEIQRTDTAYFEILRDFQVDPR